MNWKAYPVGQILEHSELIGESGNRLYTTVGRAYNFFTLARRRLIFHVAPEAPANDG